MNTLDLMRKAMYSVDPDGDVEIEIDMGIATGSYYAYLTKDDLLSMLEEIKKWEENEK